MKIISCILAQAPAEPLALFATACGAAGMRRISRKDRVPHNGAHGEQVLHAARSGVAVTITYAPGGRLLHRDPVLQDEPDGYLEVVFSASIPVDTARFHRAAANAVGAWLLEREVPWALQFMDGPWQKGCFPLSVTPSRPQ